MTLAGLKNIWVLKLLLFYQATLMLLLGLDKICIDHTATKLQTKH